MNAEAILEQLETLGIQAEVDGCEVYVEPAERVPESLWSDLSLAKLDLFVIFMTRQIIESTPTEDALIERLRRGHEWINQSADVLANHPDHGEGTERLPITMRWTKVWHRLDKHLRDTYPFTGCILGGDTCLSIGWLWCDCCTEVING